MYSEEENQGGICGNKNGPGFSTKQKTAVGRCYDHILGLCGNNISRKCVDATKHHNRQRDVRSYRWDVVWFSWHPCVKHNPASLVSQEMEIALFILAS